MSQYVSLENQLQLYLTHQLTSYSETFLCCQSKAGPAPEIRLTNDSGTYGWTVRPSRRLDPQFAGK